MAKVFRPAKIDEETYYLVKRIQEDIEKAFSIKLSGGSILKDALQNYDPKLLEKKLREARFNKQK